MNSTQLTGRQKNVMAGTTSDVSATTSTQGPPGPPGPAGGNSATLLIASSVDLLGPVITSGGANATTFTYIGGGAFTVPAGQIAIVKNCYMKITAVSITGTYSPTGWILPVFRIYKGGTNLQVAATLNFTAARYLITDHFGFGSTPAGGRRTSLAGESLIIGPSAAYSPGTSGFTYDTLTVDAYAECLVVDA